MLFLPKFDPDEILALLPRATAMMGVPTFYVPAPLAAPGSSRGTPTRTCACSSRGSAPLLARPTRRSCERTGHAILERYGMTEPT